MNKLTPIAVALTQAGIRLPLLRRACRMSQRTFFADARSRNLVALRGIYFLRPGSILL
jgi:hypothetical protein